MTSSAARIGVDEFASSDTMLRLLLMMSSSIVGAEQRIGEPLSALAVLTGRHTEKKHARPKMFGAKRVSVFATDR